MKDFSFLTNPHPEYIENLYQDFVKDPQSVDPEFMKFFQGFDFAIEHGNGHSSENIASGPVTTAPGNIDWDGEFKVFKMIRAYRKRAHLISDTNPIRNRKDRNACVALDCFDLVEADLKKEFHAGNFLGLGKTSLKDIQAKLKEIYAGHVGIEYTYINDEEKCQWVEKEFEKAMSSDLPKEKKKRILQKLNESVIFEKFLHTKYIGQKRFSLEGGESTIAGLDAIINEAADNSVQEVVIGMAHRGRLNILANTLQKTYKQIFSEFEGTMPEDTTMGSGDVKYHLGFRSNVETLHGKEINIQIAPNPSHLESVNPIVEGFARAKADTLYDSDYDKILPILLHGDASIAGQGIVYEVLQMSKLKGYYTGGTIHFVINNQIGFTTDFDDARSTDYCTSIASMVQAPVFHVNGDDTEAVVKVCELALKFRQKFNSDVFIDMVCYRKWGHNEGDDPKFTQPHLYDLIGKHKNPRELYVEDLKKKGLVDEKRAKELEEEFWSDLQKRLDEVKEEPLEYIRQKPEIAWGSLEKAQPEAFFESPDTSITVDEFKKVFDSIMNLPEGFSALRKIDKLLRDKRKLFEEKQQIDWATGELMAYASLLNEGHNVRMSGQDVKRGTFSHRHSVIRDQKKQESYNRLNHISEKQGEFKIYNSLLSEFAVLGFEYGYAMADPHCLSIWEAQFGDFFNGAQVIVDQYITSAETKWGKNNGLVMLLPHGFEGQGPEHSSGRIERFLQACSELNMIVTNCTTSANFFHVLRRQLKFNFRKPLINFSPKANLRLDKAYSHVSDFTNGKFQEVIDDKYISTTSQVKRVLLCSGKIYFDLLNKQQAESRKDIAIVRVEQLYPFPHNQIELIRKKYASAQFVWVQEEPYNMGAVAFLKLILDAKFNIGYLARKASAATATGYAKQHAAEQEAILNQAFSFNK
jgi:2-oxoglutarate dehydrogenase E1 component